MRARQLVHTKYITKKIVVVLLSVGVLFGRRIKLIMKKWNESFKLILKIELRSALYLNDALVSCLTDQDEALGNV